MAVEIIELLLEDSTILDQNMEFSIQMFAAEFLAFLPVQLLMCFLNHPTS
jgi:hypothetical protein